MYCMKPLNPVKLPYIAKTNTISTMKIKVLNNKWCIIMYCMIPHNPIKLPYITITKTMSNQKIKLYRIK